MEIDEWWRHNGRRELVKFVSDLHDARKSVIKAYAHAKLVRSYSEQCEALYQNLEALNEGLDETITIASQEADKLQHEMQDPLAIPPPKTASIRSQRLTPLQRALQREGVVFENHPILPTHEQSRPTHYKPPTILPFTLKQKKKYPARKRNIEEGRIPL